MAKNKPSQVLDSSSRGPFLAVLLVIALFGAGFVLFKKKNDSVGGAVASLEELQTKYANAGPPQPYVLGDSTAPVLIEEFADYQCPSCAQYAIITEPDVRKRLVETGQAYYKFYEFPLPMHRHAPAASLAAACADDQGKFWEMQYQVFYGQDQWGTGPNGREVVNNPKSVFKEFAQMVGLDLNAWEDCYDSGRHNDRVAANAAEAIRRNVQSTPTFFINGKMHMGALSYDAMKRLVDEAARSVTSSTDSAFSNVIQR